MVTRTVTVRLRADISNYTRGMRTAARSSSDLAGMGAAASTALVAGFAVAAAAAAKFDKALSNVRAVSGASAADMEKLRAAALAAGKSTSYSATQAADAEAELARAGVSVANITGGALTGSLALAASGQLDLAEAATISAQAMNTFGLSGQDVGHIADVLSAGANKSAADVHGLGEALRQGGLVANQTGLSLEDTVGTLSAFADHALIGSDAGTSLKTMLQRLTPQSKEAAAMMDKLGFSAYDSSGQFVGMSELSQRLKDSFSKLTPEARNSAMATIFGSDAVRGATVLYELGAKGVDKYTAAVDDSGAAARMAAIQTDNLSGDFERLKGALEVALIEGGSAANGALRGLTQTITKLINAYSSLPPELQKGVTMFSGIAGTAGLAATGLLLLLPRIASTRTALAEMGVTAARTRTAMGLLGKTGLVVAGLVAVSYASSKLRDAFADAPPSAAKMSSSLVDLAKNGKSSGELLNTFGANLDGFGEAVKRIAHPSGGARATDIVNSITFDLTKGLMESQIPLDTAHSQLDAIDQSLAGLVQSGNGDVAAKAFKSLAAEANATGTSTEKLKTLLPGYTDALAGVDTQSKLTGDSQSALGDAASTTADAMTDQRTEAEKLTDALNLLNGVNISAAEGQINFQQSLADISSAVKDNGHSLDVHTEKGRKNKQAVLDSIKAAQDYAVAIADQTGSQAKGEKAFNTSIAALKQQMHAAGYSTDAINKLISAYAKLPPKTATEVKADTAKAVSDLADVKKQLKGVPAGKSISVKAPSAAAIAALKAVGYKVKTLPNGKVQISVPTSSQKAALRDLQARINALQDKTVVLTIRQAVTAGTMSSQGAKNAIATRAAGGRIGRYASGGSPLWAPFGGAISGPGTGTSDSIPAWVSNGEYVIKAAAVRKYGATMFDRLNGMRFASGGSIGGYASGGFTYTPTSTPALGGTTDAKQRYDDLVSRLKDAWSQYQTAMKDLAKIRKGKHTKAELQAAQKKVTAEYAAVTSLDKALGLSKGAKAPSSFNLKAYQKQLGVSLAATEKWRGNLAKIGKRGGAEVQALLEGMGEDGYALVISLAGASDKQFKDITAKLIKTGEVAKATLADFNKQLGASTKTNKQFAADLQKLAAEGFGDLAQMLAAQGDDAAVALAHQAAGSSKAASTANKAVKANTATLTGEDLTNALTLLSTLRGGAGRGYADLIAAGLDTATIKALVPKMAAQIKALPAQYKDTFVQQWVSQGGVAMARGGILNRPTAVLGGEAGVRESWIPWDGSARSRSLMAATASAAGYQLVPAGRFASGGGGSAGPTHLDQSRTIVLQGAKQSAGEQVADVMRHMVALA